MELPSREELRHIVELSKSTDVIINTGHLLETASMVADIGNAIFDHIEVGTQPKATELINWVTLLGTINERLVDSTPKEIREFYKKYGDYE